MARTISVGIGEVKTSREQFDTLTAVGLGACVAVCAYDHREKIAGIAQVALPSGEGVDAPRGRFADLAIPSLISAMTEMNADVARIRAALVGGAELFAALSSHARYDLGARNVDAIRRAFARIGVVVIAEDIGGMVGRSVCMSTQGVLKVATAGGPERELISFAHRS